MNLVFPDSRCLDLSCVEETHRAPVEGETFTVRNFPDHLNVEEGDYMVNHVDWELTFDRMVPTIYLEKSNLRKKE